MTRWSSGAIRITVFALVLAPAWGLTQVSPVAEIVAIDHLILGVSDLSNGVSEFQQRTGVKPVIGGKHPGRGTQNALVSLGARTYLEIIAPLAGAELDDTFAALRSMKTLSPLGWAVSSTDLARTARRLNSAGFETSEPQAGSRIRPDGTRLDWKTLDITSPSMTSAPFFIQWGDGSAHPSVTSPGGCTLSSLRLAESPSESLRKLVLALGLDVIVAETKQQLISLTLACPKGTILFEQTLRER